MRITYVDHSCFTVEMGNVVCIFDYFRGELPTFEKEKELYFFASHKHQDHFSLDIFKIGKEYENVTYVLSNDIRLGDNYLIRNEIDPVVKESVLRIGKNVTKEIETKDGIMTVETLRSTDEGVAYVITYQGKTIYHAGDLNWWTWKGETEEEYEAMTRGYLTEIGRIKDRTIDVAFVVLDPRQEERYWWGFDAFMKETDTACVFPMHCWGDYTVIPKLLERKEADAYKTKIQEIQYEGQQFEV